jgi:hypothetical protein
MAGGSNGLEPTTARARKERSKKQVTSLPHLRRGQEVRQGRRTGLEPAGHWLAAPDAPAQGYLVRAMFVASTVPFWLSPWTVTDWPALRSLSAPGTWTVVVPEVLTVMTVPSSCST